MSCCGRTGGGKGGPDAQKKPRRPKGGGLVPVRAKTLWGGPSVCGVWPAGMHPAAPVTG